MPASPPGAPFGLRAVLVVVVSVLLAGCTVPAPRPDRDEDGAVAAAEVLAAALNRKDLTPVPFAGSSGAEVNTTFQELVRGMGPVRPEVLVGVVDVVDGEATAALNYRWTFPGVPAPWTYDASVQLVREGEQWRPRWQPAVLEPSLDAGTRLSQRRVYPERGEVLGAAGQEIVTLRPVTRIGLDKSKVEAAAVPAAARRLAELVGIDAKDYAEKVAAAGPEAFVEALTLRAGARELPSNARVAAIRGALAIPEQQMLAPSRTFARAILGTVGEATKDEVDDSAGAVVAGDQVGRSGLQKRYDERLRGVPGVQVSKLATVAAGTGASASPTPTTTPSPRPQPAVLYRVDPVDGERLELTLEVDLQRQAERLLADTKPASAIVAVRPSTGAVLAAANGPGAGEQSVATTGQFAPGSTFKVVSALALLRAGLTPSSPVRCPATLEVDGRRFKNYSDYPSTQLGRINLRTALAYSCNTAFIGARTELDPGALEEAAGSLGLGTDYDVGFPSFFGSVPRESRPTAEGAAMIGQGRNLASPLSMAAVAASVTAGQTVVPHLVVGQEAKPSAEPLTQQEGEQLRGMMRAVATEGSAARLLGNLPGPPVAAKTGTAEYGNDDPPRTHAWMIASQGDLAVAVFVADGESGSATAGPLLREFLLQAR